MIVPRSKMALGACVLSLSLFGCAARTDETSEDIDMTGAAMGAAPIIKLDTQGAGATKYPIVLHQGWRTSNGQAITPLAFYQVRQALEADGHIVVESEGTPSDGVAVRALSLGRSIGRARDKCIIARARGSRCDPARVNVIAHSTGGLDARYLISKTRYGDRIASLTTLGTPHRGTAIADAVLADDSANTADAVAAFGAFAGLGRESISRDVKLRAAVEDMATKNAARFESEHPNDPRVHYQSWAGVSSVAGEPSAKDLEACGGKLLTFSDRRARTQNVVLFTAPIVAGEAKLANDGLTTVASAKWGEFRGCVAADHAGMIGQPAHDSFDSWTGFDHRVFLRNVAFDLAKRGF